MLFECLDLWVPPVFRQGELALSSIQRRVDSVFERTLVSVILQPILSSKYNKSTIAVAAVHTIMLHPLGKCVSQIDGSLMDDSK